MTQTLSVTCKISELDLRYFVEKKGRLVIWVSRVIACAVPAYLAYLLIRYPRHRSGLDLLILLLPIVFLILFTFYFGFFHYQQLARAMLKKNTAMREGSRYSFSENGVESEDLHGRAHLKWAGIQKAAEDERMFLLYVQNGAAVLLPKNCFGDETEIRKMKAILRAALQERAQLLPSQS